MIGIFDDSGNRLAIGYNGFTLNDPNDAIDDIVEVNQVLQLAPIDRIQEARPNEDGSEIYGARKQLFVLRLDVTLRADTLARFFDRRRLIANAFDPAKIAQDNEDPFLPLDFYVPTEDTTEYPTGKAHCIYYATPRTIPLFPTSQYTGQAAFSAIEMLVADPRRYGYSQDVLSGAGTANNEGDYRTWPTLTITMAGAGSATYSVDNTTLSGVDPLVLNLSGRSNGQTVSVDFMRKKIEVDGTEMPSLYVSGGWGHYLQPGNNSISYANTTNATSVLSWRRAWSA